MNNHPEVATRWLETAAVQAASSVPVPNNDTKWETSATSAPSVKPQQIEQMLKQVQRKLPPGYKEVEKVKGLNELIVKVIEAAARL